MRAKCRPLEDNSEVDKIIPKSYIASELKSVVKSCLSSLVRWTEQRIWAQPISAHRPLFEEWSLTTTPQMIHCPYCPWKLSPEGLYSYRLLSQVENHLVWLSLTRSRGPSDGFRLGGWTVGLHRKTSVWLNQGWHPCSFQMAKRLMSIYALGRGHNLLGRNAHSLLRCFGLFQSDEPQINVDFTVFACE